MTQCHPPGCRRNAAMQRPNSMGDHKLTRMGKRRAATGQSSDTCHPNARLPEIHPIKHENSMSLITSPLIYQASNTVHTISVECNPKLVTPYLTPNKKPIGTIGSSRRSGFQKFKTAFVVVVVVVAVSATSRCVASC